MHDILKEKLEKCYKGKYLSDYEILKSFNARLFSQNVGKLKHQYKARIIRYKNGFENEVIAFEKEKSIFVNMESKLKFNKKCTCQDEEKIRKYQEFASMRAKTRIRRLIVNNALGFHWVTTYKDNVEDREKVLLDNKNFIKRLSYFLKQKIEYVAVPEIQHDRYLNTGFKVYHMHIALALRVEIRDFWSVWNDKKCLKCKLYSNKKNDFQCGDCPLFKGVVYVKNLDALDALKVGGYFSKYFSKGFDDKDLNQRKFSAKRYLNSHYLDMPRVQNLYIDDEKMIKIKEISNFSKDFPDGGSYSSLDSSILDLILRGDI